MTAEPLSASDKTLVVLEAVLIHPRFTDVVSATGLAKASVHRIIQTLVEHGFITVGMDGHYLPGPKALAIAGRAFEHIDISSLAMPVIDELVEATECTVHVGALNGHEAIYVARRDSNKPYRMPSRVGKSILLHSTGIGKVMLAEFSTAQVEQYIAQSGLASRTPHTISTRKGLFAELDRVRDQGFATDDEENEPGIRCVAAGIRDHTGVTSYGLSISTLTLEHSLDQIRAHAPLALRAAADISTALGYRGRLSA